MIKNFKEFWEYVLKSILPTMVVSGAIIGIIDCVEDKCYGENRIWNFNIYKIREIQNYHRTLNYINPGLEMKNIDPASVFIVVFAIICVIWIIIYYDNLDRER